MWIAKENGKKRNFKMPSRKKVLSKNSFVYWNFVFRVIFSKHNRTQSRSVLVHISLIWLISWVEGSQLCVHVRFLVERILLLHFFFLFFSIAGTSDWFKSEIAVKFDDDYKDENISYHSMVSVLTSHRMEAVSRAVFVCRSRTNFSKFKNCENEVSQNVVFEPLSFSRRTVF